MVCYYRDPAATESALKDGWLYTGDMATQDEDGFIFLVDRKKDVIITGGENLYPVQIEDYIRGFEKVSDVAVIGLPDERQKPTYMPCQKEPQNGTEATVGTRGSQKRRSRLSVTANKKSRNQNHGRRQKPADHTPEQMHIGVFRSKKSFRNLAKEKHLGA